MARQLMSILVIALGLTVAQRLRADVPTIPAIGDVTNPLIIPEPLENPIPSPIPAGTIIVRLETLATGLTAPNGGTVVPDQPGRLFVNDQNGVLWAIDLMTGNKTVLLDVSARLVDLGIGGPGGYDERGFLGVAFHPDYTSNGLLYTYTSEPISGTADFSTISPGETANHQSVINEWRVPDPVSLSSVVDPGSVRQILRIDEPQFNHNGGQLNFGPDGFLYISLGDGGGADDEAVGHGTIGNGQDPSTVLGTLLRIDPAGSNSANGRYGVPPDNPFVGMNGFVPEIFAYGFRNPFRFSFDSLTGSLYVGDVGQNNIEEVDVVTAGGNYGWRIMEGSFFFDRNGPQAGFVHNVDPGGTQGLIRPIAEYDHDEGSAIIGGFVYRGSMLPNLVGRYVFGDFASIFNGEGRLFYLDGGGVVRELQIAGRKGIGMPLLGLAQDENGELYVLANATGTALGSTGVVLRIAPATTPCAAGDCSADGQVKINELIAAVSIALGQANLSICATADADQDGSVTVSELIMAVNVALTGCR